MATLYLVEQNTVLRKSSKRLTLCRKSPKGRKSPGVRVSDILLELPCEDIDQVMLFGNIQVTTQALQQLLRHGIEMAIFTASGKLLGQLTPPKTRNIDLRIAQFEKYHDQDFVLAISRAFVTAKLGNALTMLRQHSWNHPDLFADGEMAKFERLLQNVNTAKDLAELRGVEGSSSAIYFRLFERVLNPPWKFPKRSRRPPQDPVNAILSFGYVVVGAELQSLLDGIGFDPYLGFYHTIRYGRPGLALDMLEEFRHCLVDRLALNMFNKLILNENDFYSPARGGVLMNLSGKKKFFKQYEKMLGEFAGVSRPATGAKTYRNVFQQQIYLLANCLQKGTPYVGFKAE